MRGCLSAARARDNVIDWLLRPAIAGLAERFIARFPSRLKPRSTSLKSRSNDLTGLPTTYRTASSYRGSFSALEGIRRDRGLKAKRIAVDTPALPACPRTCTRSGILFARDITDTIAARRRPASCEIAAEMDHSSLFRARFRDSVVISRRGIIRGRGKGGGRVMRTCISRK